MAQFRTTVSQPWGAEGRAAFRFGGMSEVNMLMLKRNDRRLEILRHAAGELVAESIGSKSPRPGQRRAQSTGFLTKITASQQNTWVTPTTIAIGREDWLDKQTARYGRYWRSFEAGTTMFVGRQVTILNKNNSSRGTRGRSTATDDLRMATGNFGFRRSEAGPLLRITRPIQPHNIYGRLAEQYRPQLRQDLILNARDFFAGLTSNRVR